MMVDYNTTTDLTLDGFIKHERAVWGDEYVFDLFDRGYTVHLTDRGWRWFAPVITRNSVATHVTAH